MRLNDKNLKEILNNKNPHTLRAMYMDKQVILSINLSKNIFSNLEVLSLFSNNLKDMSFIENLNYLFYLDVRNNPFDSYLSLNKKSCFGFLAVTECCQFLQDLPKINRLTVGILIISNKTNDDRYKKYFLKNNKNILKLNNRILYETDFTSQSNTKSIKLADLDTDKAFDLLTETQNSFSPKCLDLVTFFTCFRDANQVDLDTLHLESELTRLLDVEKSKIVKLYNIYESIRIIVFSNNANVHCAHEWYQPRSINFHKFSLFFEVNDTYLQILVLTILLLYLLRVIDQRLAVVLLKYVHRAILKDTTKDFTRLENQLSHDDPIILFSYYYFQVKSIETRLNVKENEIGSGKEQVITGNGTKSINNINAYNALKMLNLIFKVNLVIDEVTAYEQIIYNKDLLSAERKVVIGKYMIKLLKNDLGVLNDVLQLMQLVDDFIKLNELDFYLKENYCFDYSVFLEIRSFMFVSSDFFLNKKEFSKRTSLNSLEKYKVAEIRNNVLLSKFLVSDKVVRQRPIPKYLSRNFSNYSYKEREKDHEAISTHNILGEVETVGRGVIDENTDQNLWHNIEAEASSTRCKSVKNINRMTKLDPDSEVKEKKNRNTSYYKFEPKNIETLKLLYNKSKSTTSLVSIQKKHHSHQKEDLYSQELRKLLTTNAIKYPESNKYKESYNIVENLNQITPLIGNQRKFSINEDALREYCNKVVVLKPIQTLINSKACAIHRPKSVAVFPNYAKCNVLSSTLKFEKIKNFVEEKVDGLMSAKNPIKKKRMSLTKAFTHINTQVDRNMKPNFKGLKKVDIKSLIRLSKQRKAEEDVFLTNVPVKIVK